MLNQLAMILYFTVCTACGGAALVSARSSARTSEWARWLAISVAFALLALARWTGFEERARSALREVMREGHFYEDRWLIQAPAMIGLAVVMAVAVYLGARLVRRSFGSHRKLALLAAQFATLGFVPLFAMRFISLHAIDQLLYDWPFKLNWLMDGGLALVVIASAAIYVWDVRKSAGPNQRGAKASR